MRRMTPVGHSPARHLTSRWLQGLLLGSAFAVALAGCKLTIKVPDGGMVSSGGIICPAGQTCTIDISTTTFDETFQALPAVGYEFAGWVTDNGFLCGGSSDPCTVSTLFFAGNPALESLLDDDIDVYLAPQFERRAGLEDPTFRTAFAGATQVVDPGGLFGDIIGYDSSVAAPNDWVTDLEGGNPFNNFRLYFEGGTTREREVLRTQDQAGSGEWFLRFLINEPNVVIQDDDGIACNGISHYDSAGQAVPEERKSRIQAVLRDTPALRQIDYQVRVRFGDAFPVYVAAPVPVKWMTLAEFWNDLPASQPSAAATGFRIKLVAWKKQDTVGAPFHWYVHAETQNTSVKGKWDALWESEQTHAPVEIPLDGQWITLRLTLIEGDAASGRVIVTATDETGWTQTIVDRTDWTRHPNAPADGFEAINPMKLYTNDDYVCGLRQQAGLPLSVDWDDFVIGGSTAP